MAYERSWQPMAVQGPRVASAGDAQQYYLWLLAQMLLGRVGTAASGLYTVCYSCDGTTAGTFDDGVDRWTSTFDATKIPLSATAGTNIRGWMVLKRTWSVNSSTFTTYILLSGYTGNIPGWSRVLSSLAISGGTTTTEPTQTSIICDSNPAAGSTQESANTTNGRRYYGNMSTGGDFWFGETCNGEFVRGTMLYSPVGTKANDQCPFWGYHTQNFIPYSGQVSGPFGGSSLYSKGNPAYNTGGTTTYYNGSTGYPAVERSTLTCLLDASDVSIFDRPAYICVGSTANNTPTAIHSRGRLPDVGLSSMVLDATAATFRPCNIGTTIKDLSNNIVYVTANQMILPYNAAIT